MAARDSLHQIYLDHVNKSFAMNRQVAAAGWGLEEKPYSEPYHAPSTTNIYLPPVPEQPAPAAPAAAKAGGILKTLAMTALMATGGGGLVAAGGYGAYSLLKEQLNKPVQIDPATFKTKISFDPDKGGFQVGPLEPDK